MRVSVSLEPVTRFRGKCLSFDPTENSNLCVQDGCIVSEYNNIHGKRRKINVLTSENHFKTQYLFIGCHYPVMEQLVKPIFHLRKYPMSNW